MNGVICPIPSDKQIRMITGLLWELRPYYLYPQWQEIEDKLDQLLQTATMQKCSQLIQRMLAVRAEKQGQKRYWIPMNYRLSEPDWRKNIARMASSLFPDERDSFDDLNPDDLEAWRELKNRVEREELRRSYEFVADEFENDTRLAQMEEDRWKLGKQPYAQLVSGIDWIDPVPGIDY